MEVHNCIGGGDQNHPKEKETQEGKVVVWTGLNTNWEKKRSKGNGERGRYTQLNAEFQRRDKKAFLSEQCKEIEETIKWDGLEISSRKLERSREYFMQRQAQ